ncbi:putative major facilitator superfamily protein [Lyophyllum shimeji]|uniref:Major facilitator superfamily protein n=1 Tax=Lyophyllum shimeji TaxID=47721 RepID=A0A9P3Q076_LYOSH|nr:putative major facilitator superfamily protein [Lyophyllum shimeji]
MHTSLGGQAAQEGPVVKRTALPKFQLLIVFWIQLSESVTATVNYPFINQFVRDTDVTGGEERRTGYYAGIVGSAFFFAEAVTVFPWGRASDRVGRRPILLLGPFGLALAMFSFGLADKYWMLALTRCIQGMFNGNIGVSKTVIAEITDFTNITDAFAMMPLVYSVGITIGPILGGILAEPAKRWPRLFGKTGFFHDHPYFLPCAAAGLCALLPGILGLFGLKETLPPTIQQQKSRRPVRDTLETSDTDATSVTPLLASDIPEYGSSDCHDAPGRAEAEHAAKRYADGPPPFSALLIPQVLLPLVVYMVLAFISTSSQMLLPLMYSTSIPIGGLGLDPYHIGIILSAFGFVNAIVQLLLLPPLVRRFGPKKLCLAAMSGSGGLESLGSHSSPAHDTSDKPYGVGLHSANDCGRCTESSIIGRHQWPSTGCGLFCKICRALRGHMVYFVLLGCTFLGLRLAFLLPQELRSQKN